MVLASVGLKTHIWNNNLRSMILLGAYPVLILILVWAISFFISFMTQPSSINMGAVSGYSEMDIPISFANNTLYDFWPIIVSAVSIWFMIAWFFNTKMVRKLSRSHPVARKEEPELFNLLENLSITAGIITPKLEIIESDALNAFASGISQNTYTVTVTRGLMNRLDKEELEGVLAHELTHILNKDVRLLIVCVIFTGMIGFAAQLAWNNIRYGLLFRGRGKNKGKGLILMLGIAAILGVGYLLTLVTRFAISRNREYMADGGAIELTKNPEAMMRALMKISGKERIAGMAEDVAMMCFENAKPFMGMFATHPSVDSRVQMISQTSGAPVPTPESLVSKEAAQAVDSNQEQGASSGAAAQDPHKKNPWADPKNAKSQTAQTKNKAPAADLWQDNT